MNPSVLLQNGSIDMLNVSEGGAILLVGILALLLWATITFKNAAGVALWCLTVVLVALSALFGIGIEVVYIGVLLTAVLTIVGVTARVIT